jgi:hypothetical protein
MSDERSLQSALHATPTGPISRRGRDDLAPTTPPKRDFCSQPACWARGKGSRSASQSSQSSQSSSSSSSSQRSQHSQHSQHSQPRRGELENRRRAARAARAARGVMQRAAGISATGRPPGRAICKPPGAGEWRAGGASTEPTAFDK